MADSQIFFSADPIPWVGLRLARSAMDGSHGKLVSEASPPPICNASLLAALWGVSVGYKIQGLFCSSCQLLSTEPRLLVCHKVGLSVQSHTRIHTCTLGVCLPKLLFPSVNSARS